MLSKAEKWAIWRHLCGLAVELCGSQENFRPQARILKRLAQQYGPERVEHMLRGAIALRWDSLVSLGSADGLGRRMAEKAYWTEQNKGPMPESLKSIFRRLGT
jgi:hypothetical protein